MRNEEFEIFLSTVARLDVEQKQRLEAALAGGEDEAVVIRLLEARLGPEPACPHCETDGSRPWGHQSRVEALAMCGLWPDVQCADRHTAGAPAQEGAIVELRCVSFPKRHRSPGAAKICRVAVATSFRWRHRFLRAGVADAEALSGIVEADETFFRRSFKGTVLAKQADPPPRPPKDAPHRLASAA
ncbi:MAG: hypothetical protein R3C97_18295 [Geminicoccaceae bacterium]